MGKIEERKDSGRLQKVSAYEKTFLDRAVYEATKAKGKKLTSEERRKVLIVARGQIRSQRKADKIRKDREEAYKSNDASVSFNWKKPEPYRR